MLNRYGVLFIIPLILAAMYRPAPAETLSAQNEALFTQLQNQHGLSERQIDNIREIFTRSGYMGQGNPNITEHPVTPEECRANRALRPSSAENETFQRICSDRYMAPLYDPATQRPEDARACIDQFEFPNIPCAYPVVWVRAREAAEICAAMGKRICDAHEWEGACEGSLQPPDYPFELAEDVSTSQAAGRMRASHNRRYKIRKKWSYGSAYKKGVCAADSSKSPACPGGGWANCGSNTYPAGAFPDCRSSLDVYDLHGNAAEHMNLPLNERQMASRGSTELGVTEMKGSWFIFDKYYAHQDWCRWRAPFWHGSRVMSKKSHRNYHLGFRCCKTVAPQ